METTGDVIDAPYRVTVFASSYFFDFSITLGQKKQKIAL